MAEKGEKCWVIRNDPEYLTVVQGTVLEDLPEENATIFQLSKEIVRRKMDNNNVWFSEREAWEEVRQRLREVEKDLSHRKEQVSARIADVDKTLLELTIDTAREQKILERGYFIPGDVLWAAFPDGVYQVIVRKLHLDWSASLQYVDSDPKEDNWFELSLSQLFVTKAEAKAYKDKEWVAPEKPARECIGKNK